MNNGPATSVTFTDEEEISKPRLGINYEGNKLYTPMGLGWYGSLKGLYSNIYSGQHPALLGKSHNEEEEGEAWGVHISYTTSDFSTWNCVTQISPEFWNGIDPTITNLRLEAQLGFINKSTGKMDSWFSRDATGNLNYGDTGTFEFTFIRNMSPNSYWGAVEIQGFSDGRNMARWDGCAQDFSSGKVGDVFAVSMPTYSYTDPLVKFAYTKTWNGRNLTVNVTRLEPSGSYEFGYYRGIEWVKLNDFAIGTTTTTLPDEMVGLGTGNTLVPDIYMKRTGDDKAIFSFSHSGSGSWYSTFYADSMAHNAIFE